MKVRISRKINETNLTLMEVQHRFIDGYVSKDWSEKISMILQAIKRNKSTWIWPNANLQFTSNGETYAVTSIY